MNMVYLVKDLVKVVKVGQGRSRSTKLIMEGKADL